MAMWKNCKENPPKPYVRVEIKADKGQRYIGYYTGHGVYLESYKHNVIKSPKWWRFPPKGSAMVEELLRKFQGVVAVYASVGSQAARN